MSINENEIRYFERKMVESAYEDAIKICPDKVDAISKAKLIKLRGVISFSEYITYLQNTTGNSGQFFKYRF